MRAVQETRAGASFVRSEYLSKPMEDTVFDFIESWHPDIDLGHVLEQVESIYLNLSVFGNAFVRVVVSSVGGAASVFFESIDAEKVRYLITSDGSKQVGISALWDFEYTSRVFPEIVPVYPGFSETEAGAKQAVIHIKTMAVGRDWYGLPKSYPSLFYQFLEYQLGDYGTKGYANQWTAKVFIETAGDNVDFDSEEMQDFRDNLRNVFSAGGKGSTVLHRHRNEADPATLVKEFQDTKGHEFHSQMADIAEKQIIKSHDWSHVLMSVPSPGKLGGQSDFNEIYKTKYGGVIIPLQDKVMAPVNLVYQIALKAMPSGPRASLALQNLVSQDKIEAKVETEVETEVHNGNAVNS